uniref:Uncharacterized protein n=1 Tax=Anguilla anguilla TaxID=7936 RepID=A0A0E9U5E9_ANGAN
MLSSVTFTHNSLCAHTEMHKLNLNENKNKFKMKSTHLHGGA